MPLTRRGFARTIGLGTAGLLSSSFVIGRGREAAAFEPEWAGEPFDDHIIKISSNENARGPGASTLKALHSAISVRAGRGYPIDHGADLVTVIAGIYGVEENNVAVGTGSGDLLRGAVRAFCSGTKPLVQGSPTFGYCEQVARRIGVPVKKIPVDSSLGLDLEGMAEAATGAGLVFLCNPNNPTPTVHTATAVEAFVRRVMRNSPATKILIDEAYMEYTFGPDIETAAPLTQEFPSVFITRSFSKAHGMAGLRVGYGIGHEETLDAIRSAWNLGSMNTLSAAAAIASLKDQKHMAEEREENARVRQFTLDAFRDLGFETPDSYTNFVFVDLKRPASVFRDACLAQSVRVGRDFPPMEQTHCRISLGTMAEMEKAVSVFRSVL